MGELLSSTRSRWGDPREILGLTVSPLKMEVYPLWLAFSGALTVRLSTLPARYAVRTYADALYTLMRETKDTKYLMFKILMGLSLGVPEAFIHRCIAESADETGLKSVIIQYGETRAAFLPRQIDEMRKAIAEMNGAELPDESENAEIMQAEEDLKSIGARRDLKMDLFDEMASVAAASNLRMEDIREMTILEYTRLRRAHNRRLMYLVCAISEGMGSKFKGGNPAPSWMFDKTDPSHGLVDLKKWQESMGDAIKTGAPPGMEKMIPQIP